MSAQRSVRPGTANQDRKDNLNQSEGKGVTVELVTAMLTAMPASTATVAAVVVVAVVMAVAMLQLGLVLVLVRWCLWSCWLPVKAVVMWL